MSLQNSQIYTLEDKELADWPEVTKRQLERVRIHVVCLEVPLRVVERFRLKHPVAPTSQVPEVDENQEVVT